MVWLLFKKNKDFSFILNLYLLTDSPKVVSVSTLAWLINYIYYCIVQLLIKVVVNRTKVILHPGIGDISRI
jgi:hypothetical protein